MVRCVEREVHEKSEPGAQLSSAVAMEISNDCAMVMTSVWLHDRSSFKLFEKSLRKV